MRFGFLISTILSLAKLGQTAVAVSHPVSQNFIKNGDFKQNSLFGVTWVNTDTLPGWETTNVQEGQGIIYNKRWGKAIVVQLDSYKNDKIVQKVKLNPGTYLFEMDYAGREGFVNSCGMIVKWNNQVISNINATDQQLKKLSISVQSNGGINVLQISGSGPSDGVGMTISNVQLHSNENASLVKKESYIWRVTGKSMLVNGDFQTPTPTLANDKTIISSLNGWKLNSKIEQGVGGIYNKKWGKKIVIVLNGNKESSISQVIHLQKGQYRFQLDYAGRTSTKYSNLNIILNGEVIAQIEGKDEQPRTYGVNIFINESADNIFQISPQSPAGSTGMTISGAYLFPIHRQIKFDKNEQCYKTQ